MSDRTEISARPQSCGEEIANSISHGVASLAAIAAIPVLAIGADRSGGLSTVIGASVFGATMLLLYLSSTLYHALPAGRAKRVFQILDHCAIFLLIAGTYTPFTLGVLRGSLGWTLFGLVWGLTAFGIILKAVFGTRYQGLSTALYLIMGWLGVIAAQPLFNALPTSGLLWLVGGGLAYTLGVVFFVLDHRLRYAHFIWHLFVVTGSFCHFIAVLFYAA